MSFNSLLRKSRQKATVYRDVKTFSSTGAAIRNPNNIILSTVDCVIQVRKTSSEQLYRGKIPNKVAKGFFRLEEGRLIKFDDVVEVTDGFGYRVRYRVLGIDISVMSPRIKHVEVDLVLDTQWNAGDS